MPIALAYGPPGHKGVTTLMSVGGSEDLGGDEAVLVYARQGGYIAAGVWLVGLATGIDTLKKMGFGAAVALFLVQALSKRS